MRFEIGGVTKGKELEQFQADWIGLTIEENRMILGVAQISRAQLLVINVFCGKDDGYRRADDMTITTIGPAQSEVEALFRARGRALAMFFQERLER